MKKNLIIAAAAICVAFSLTACNNSSSEQSSTVNSTSSAAVSQPQSTSSAAESQPQSTASTAESQPQSTSSAAESQPQSTTSVEESKPESTTSTAESQPESTSSETESNLVSTGGRAQKMLDAAKAYTEEWSQMMNPVTDQESFDVYMPGVTLDMLEDFVYEVEMTGISAQEIFIARPAAGSEDAVQAAADARYQNIIDNGGFYPAGEEAIAGAVKGATSDGYIYYIVHHMGKDIAAAMEAAE